MKKWLMTLALFLPVASFAAGGGYNEHVVKADINLRDNVSLQTGAKLYVNYCMGCHSLEFQRYNRMGRDLGISDELVMKHLNFTSDRVGDQMRIAMSHQDGASWFGAYPPDLTMIARAKGSDWLYSYLISFYEDPSRPFGHNNYVYENVGMPHVMANLEADLGEEQFRAAMLDLTNFMTYVAEPVRLERERLGVYVLIFLGILFIPAYLLKKEYWKDIK